MTAADFRALRRRAGTQKDVARALGVTTRVLYDVETQDAHRHRTLYAYAIRGLLWERAADAVAAQAGIN